MNRMKRQITVSLTIAAAMVLLLSTRSAVSAQVQDKAAAVALKAAIDKETLEGNPKSAIEQYKKIAESKDRFVAAQALVRMADSYRKLGDAESRRIYQRIVKDYADQKEPFALAQARLAGEQTAGPVSRVVWNGTTNVGPLTPDGRFFVWNNLRQSGDLFLHELATGIDRNLTNEPKGSPYYAVLTAIVSPDGKQIAYGWQTNSQDSREELRLVNISGDPRPRRLYGNPEVSTLFPMDWSQDGKTIAVVLQRIDHTAQIALVSASDGSTRVLKTVDWSGYGRVRFSPDGKYLGFDLPQSDLGKERDIYVLSIDGDREITAVSSPGNDNIIGWSPDGKWLVFTSDRTGATDLWAVSFTNGRPQGAPLRLKSDIGNLTPLQWTSSGSLYYTTRIGTGSRSQVLSLDFTAGKVVPSLANRNLDSVEQPVWSIDGKRLAYKVGSAHDLLAIRELDTGAVRLVRPTKLANFYLRTWAPDGRFILVDGTEPRERNGMYRVDTETGEASAVTLYDIPAHPGQTNFVATSTEWMPDGHSFLIAADRGRTGVYRVDSQTGDRSAVFLDEPGQTTVAFKLSPDGKRIFIRRQTQADNRIAFVERDLTSGAENELVRGSLGGIALSPDGRYISTVNTDSPSGSRTVLLIPTDGGESRELTLSSGVNSGVRSLGIPAWTPDGRSLLLRKTPSDSTKEAELWLVPLSGGSPKRITGDGSIPTRAQMSVSPDGRFVHTIAEPSPSSTTEISVLENFLPKTAAAGK